MLPFLNINFFKCTYFQMNSDEKSTIKTKNSANTAIMADVAND